MALSKTELAELKAEIQSTLKLQEELTKSTDTYYQIIDKIKNVNKN